MIHFPHNAGRCACAFCLLAAITSGVAQPASADAPEVVRPVAVTELFTAFRPHKGPVMVSIPEHEFKHVEPPEVLIPGPPPPPFVQRQRPVMARSLPPRRGVVRGSPPPLVSQPARSEDSAA